MEAPLLLLQIRVSFLSSLFFFFFLLTCNKSSCLEARVSPFAFESCYFSAQPRKVMCIRALWITDVQEIICGVMGYL